MANELFTGHEAEIAADSTTTYSKEQRAAAFLASAIKSLDPSSYLDFLPPPTAADMAESAIRHAQHAIDILKS